MIKELCPEIKSIVDRYKESINKLQDISDVKYQEYCDLKIAAGHTERTIMSYNDWHYCWLNAVDAKISHAAEKILEKNMIIIKLVNELKEIKGE